MIKKTIILKVLHVSLWLAIGSGLSFLLISAIIKEKIAACKNIEITFLDLSPIKMIEKNEVLNSLWPSQLRKHPVGSPLTSFNLFELEKQLGKNPWIEKADIYFDNQQCLHIDILQKNPIARVFTPEGNSFYLDHEYALLPLKTSDHFVLPVFTNFNINLFKMTHADSAVAEKIIDLSTYISNNPFWLAQIESVYIHPDHRFELTTQIGEHTIDLGMRTDWESMFGKLKKLYKKFNAEKSWGRYAHINLQYKDQVVCERSINHPMLSDSIRADSIHTIQSILKKSIIQNINPSKK